MNILLSIRRIKKLSFSRNVDSLFSFGINYIICDHNVLNWYLNKVIKIKQAYDQLTPVSNYWITIYHVRAIKNKGHKYSGR